MHQPGAREALKGSPWGLRDSMTAVLLEGGSLGGTESMHLPCSGTASGGEQGEEVN